MPSQKAFNLELAIISEPEKLEFFVVKIPKSDILILFPRFSKKHQFFVKIAKFPKKTSNKSHKKIQQKFEKKNSSVFCFFFLPFPLFVTHFHAP